MLRAIMGAAGLFQLPPSQRRVVFYSEGGACWAHFGGLLTAFLERCDVDVCYLSSQADDPGMQLQHPRLRTFRTDESWVRNWLFENLECDLMVMTTPDLDQYQVKRSKHPVHYVYVQHSLVSLHMAYRDGAFDAFDTIFCAGPHHIEEVRALEASKNLAPKQTVEHGYERLDGIMASQQKGACVEQSHRDIRNVLIAPSWGAEGIIETIGLELTGLLLDAGFEVTVRPHPQTIKLAAPSLDRINRRFGSDKRYRLDDDPASINSLHSADLMVSDWSGAALDFAFGLGKPVMFIDGPKKINNPMYESIGLEPFEVSIRSEIGAILPRDNLSAVATLAHSLLENRFGEKMSDSTARHVFNVGCSAATGASALEKILTEQKTPH